MGGGGGGGGGKVAFRKCEVLIFSSLQKHQLCMGGGGGAGVKWHFENVKS